MELKEDKIKNLFASKLDKFEPEVPTSAWNEIDNMLSSQFVYDGVEKKGSSKTIRATLIGLAVAASVGIGIFLALDKNTMPVPQGVAIEEAIQDDVKKETEIAETTSSSKEENAQSSLVSKEIISASTLAHDNSDLKKNDGTVLNLNALQKGLKTETKEEAVDEQPAKEEYEEMTLEESKEETKSSKPSNNTNKKQVTSLRALEDKPRMLAKSSNSSSTMSLSVKTNTGFMSGSESRQGNPLLFSSSDRSSKFVSMLREENKEYEMIHNQPVSVGVTVSKSLSDRLSVETGLVFTYLSSKVKSNSKLDIKEKLQFGYLGVPVYLNYNIFELGKADFYVSLGAMAQKDVYGKYTSEMSIAENLTLITDVGATSVTSFEKPEPTYIKENISQKHWQLSTHLTVGASYPIYKKLKVYTSIGGAYYLNAHNEYKTIYSDRKFQLDLNLGLKFDF